MVTQSLPEIEILDDVPKRGTKKYPTMTAAALRIKKRLFLQNEASNSEANRQLEWEKNRQKLVNSAANKATVEQSAVPTTTKIVIDNVNKIILDDNGKITVPATNNKALLTLQGRKIGDVIREGKVVKKGGLITGVIGVEMEKSQSCVLGVQNMNVGVHGRNVLSEKPSSKYFMSVSSGSKQANGQKSVPDISQSACSTSKESCESVNKVVDDIKTDIKGSDKQSILLIPSVNDIDHTVYVEVSGQKANSVLHNSNRVSKASETPVCTLSNQVLQAQLVMQPLITTNSPLSSTSAVVSQNSVQTFKAISASVEQSTSTDADHRRRNLILTEPQHVQPVTQEKADVVCISDDSDNSEVEFVGTVCNPKLDCAREKKKVPHTKREHSAIRTQANLTSRQTHIVPKAAPHVQGDTSTPRVKPVASTCNTVTAVPYQFQNVVPNPHNFTAQFASNTVVIQDKVEQHAGNQVELEMHIVSQTQDNISETLQKQMVVQPGGSTSGVLRTCQSQTKAVQYVQGQSPGPSSVATVMSPLSPSSPKNNKNVHNSLASLGTITHTQKFNSISNTAVDNIEINLESHLVPSHIPVSQSPAHINPYVVTAGTSPGTPVIQMRTPGISSDQRKRPADSFKQVISSGAPLAKTKSPVPKSSSLDQTKSPSMPFEKVKYSGALVDLTRNPCSPVAQTSSHPLLTQVRSTGSPLVQTNSPGFSSTLTRSAHTQHPVLTSANTKSPSTPVSLAKVPGTPLAQSRISSTPVTQARIPGTSVAQTRSPGTLVAHTRSLGTPVAQTRSPGTPVAQTRSPGTQVAQTRGPGTPAAQARSVGTPVAQMRSSGSIHFTQTVSSDASLVQARSSGSPLSQARIHDAYVSPTGASLSHGRGNQSRILERTANDVQQQLNQTTARLVVIPGDENVSKYALVFPSGAKVILTPKQVADIRAANGGLLTTNIGI
jgi:hypothetical protein